MVAEARMRPLFLAKALSVSTPVWFENPQSPKT